MEHWTEYTRFITALLVILDPFAAVPIFLTLTRDYTPGERSRVAFIASATVCGVLVTVTVSGEALLTTMGTSLASFRVGGGLVLLLMALAMLQAKTTDIRATSSATGDATEKSSIAIVPLAIPLLAGPGAISTVIIEMHRSSGAHHGLLVIACIVLVCAVLWLVLKLALPLGKALGPNGLNIVIRLFGLILAAIAIEIMANGMKQLFPVLAG